MFDPLRVVEDLIRCPSVSTDPDCAAGMAAARERLCALFAEMGLQVEVWPAPLHDAVFAHLPGPDDAPHLLIYGHYDVQPADPLDLWSSPAFEPEIRDGRLYGRGAADNKGPFMVHVAALQRLLAEDPRPRLRISFLVEGEEEIGSPSFRALLQDHRAQLSADGVLLSDTLTPGPDQLAITCGLRGIVAVEVALTGPAKDLHSGIHGGAAPNPIRALAALLASLHDAEGRVTVPGFYEAVQLPPPEWERAEIARLGQTDAAYAASIGAAGLMTPKGYAAAEATRLLPTLEFNGIGGGYQGAGEKTVIPSRAFCKISCRLVPHQEPQTVLDALESTLRARCPAGFQIELRRGHAGPPYSVVPPGRPGGEALSPTLQRAFAAAEAAGTEVFGSPPLYLREGGSVPIIGDIKSVLGLDSLMLGMFTPEDNLHAPDESLHLGLFERGVDVSTQILRALAEG